MYVCVTEERVCVCVKCKCFDIFPLLDSQLLPLSCSRSSCKTSIMSDVK